MVRKLHMKESDGQRWEFIAIYSDFVGTETEDRFTIYATSDMEDIWQKSLNQALRRCPHGCCLQELSLDRKRFIW